ncbi:helix-turn-helix domain-containing protein [Thermosediminibacter litoriperuensis]|uniref:Helix-turn-helix protein n=1 Tax=Thermosediminibacter litoriperuensis TaxID=291989 RepID=A0A5S5AV78_9FIRM|nr:helix-turn-helix transcriptional regulator [Thermosediminibacter litoriperuensis]TYP56803.1 helix-turn-helix protein [Thermosediminibacter litoriperuensis]
MIGERIKSLREERKITQQELAQYLGVSQKTISNYEKGERSPDPETLKKIADYFDVTVDYLLGRSNHRQLTRKDERDIEKIIEETRQRIENTEGLMLDGEILSQEDVDAIINAMRVGLEMAKLRNKEKYGRKKKK